MSWFDGIGNDIPFTNIEGDNFGEKWERELPTRSDTSRIDSCKKIIPIFGDSFMYGHGLPRTHTLDVKLQENFDDTVVINFGIPGSNNTNTIRLINQWLNTEYAEKTYCIIANIAPLPRYNLIFSPNYHAHGIRTEDGDIPTLYDETYSNRTMFQLMNNNKPDFKSSKSYENKIFNEIHNHFFEYIDTPINNIVSFEHYVTQLKWISKAIDKDIYLTIDEWIFNFLNDDDKDWVLHNISKIENESRLRRVDLSDIFENIDVKQSKLRCGHWTDFGTERVADAIYKKIIR